VNTPTTKKLLIIDDDPDQLLIVGTILRRKCACEVITASSVNEGLKLFMADGGGISLVISDVAMPGMSVEELIQTIRSNSKIPIIVVTSAYEDKKEEFLALGATSFIQKQDLTKQLAATVNELLE
jgi:DNA-binding NtrC family response regulator